MVKKTKQAVPKTIGELRQQLAKLGNPWQVNSRLGDDDPLPDHPRGGQREEEIPQEHRLASVEASTDLNTLIIAQTPANPFLKLRWAEAGLLSQEDIKGLALESGEDEGGVA